MKPDANLRVLRIHRRALLLEFPEAVGHGVFDFQRRIGGVAEGGAEGIGVHGKGLARAKVVFPGQLRGQGVELLFILYFSLLQEEENPATQSGPEQTAVGDFELRAAGNAGPGFRAFFRPEGLQLLEQQRLQVAGACDK